MRLNDTLVKNMQPNPVKDTYLPDPQTPGLFLRVYRTGKKSWVLKGTANAKRYKYALGDAMTMPCKEARAMAQKVYVELRNGHDRFEQARLEAEQAKREEEEKAKAMKVQDFADVYFAKNSRLRPATVNFYQQLLEGPLNPYLDVDPLTMAPSDVETMFEEMSERTTPARATKAIKFLKSLVTYMNGEFKIPRSVQLHTPRAKKARLEPRHGREILRQLMAMPRTPTVAFAIFLLFTGCRLGEVDRLLVGDIDLVEGCASLRDTKTHTDHKVYLCDTLIDVLRPFLKDRNPKHKLFLCADGPRHALRVIKGLPFFGAHDLRKMFAITASEQVVQYPVIKAALNHTSGSDVTLVHYLHVTPSQLRKCFETVGDYYLKTE